MSIKIENVDIHGWEAAIRSCRNPMNSWKKSDSWFIDNWNSEMEEFDCHSFDIDYAAMEETGELTDDKHSIMEVMRMIINDEGESEWPTTTIPWPYAEDENFKYPVQLILGPNDRKLLMSLCKGGPEESKWRRFVHVSMDITAPLYWWKEFETYKVGVSCNSCSTMHKIQAKEFTLEDFSCEHLIDHEDIEWPEDFDADHPYNIDGAPVVLCGFNDMQHDLYFSPKSILELQIEMLNKCRDLFLKTKDKKYWWQMIQLLPTSYNQRRTIDLNYEVLAAQYRQRKDHKLTEWHQYCDWIKTLPYSEFITMEEI